MTNPNCIEHSYPKVTEHKLLSDKTSFNGYTLYSMVNFHRRDLECFRQERNRPGIVLQVVIQSVLSFIVMKLQLCFLIRMVMMLGRIRLPEPEYANSLTDPHREHHRLHTRRVMKQRPFVTFTPIPKPFRSLTLFQELLDRVVLHDPSAQDVESRVRDDQRRGMRGFADGVVQ